MNGASRWWSRWDQMLVEGMLAIVVIGAIVAAVVVGVDVAASDELETTVDVRGQAATVDPQRSAGYLLEVRQATLVIENPSVGQKVAAGAPAVIGALVVGSAAALLLAVAASVRKGDPFHIVNARRLRAAALVVLLGGMGASLASAIGAMQLSADAAGVLPVLVTSTISLMPIPVGLALAVLSEVFRRGSILRDDVAAMV